MGSRGEFSWAWLGVAGKEDTHTRIAGILTELQRVV